MAGEERCDLAVWDIHGDLTAAVRAGLSDAVQRKGPKLVASYGEWRGRRVVVGWPRRLTASQLPSIREALIGLRAVHQPERFVIVGPASSGETGLDPGRVARLDETPGLVARWAEEARAASEHLAADAILLAAVTSQGKKAPPAHRPTAARTAGRWLGSLLQGETPATAPEVSDAVAEALAELLSP